jgi:hypothetical protein
VIDGSACETEAAGVAAVLRAQASSRGDRLFLADHTGVHLTYADTLSAAQDWAERLHGLDGMT